MYRFTAATALLAALVAVPAGAIHAQAAGKDAKMKVESALSAAPAELAKNAAVMDWDHTVLKQGTNGWTCFPDVPDTPGNDPMCLDAQWVKWADGWMNKRKPMVEALGLAYMLRGGTDASNTDPYATSPAPGETWVHSGPHLMVVVPDPAALEHLPTDPYSGGPWVMWKGTPYAHIMIPVAPAKP